MSALPNGARPVPAAEDLDADQQERADPGHFSRQGDYDDPQASLVHDDAIPPGALEMMAAAPPADEAVRDPHYRAWREMQLSALDSAYQHWRDAQARAFDASFLTWRNSAGETSFAQWRETAASAQLPSDLDELFARVPRP